MLRRTIFLCILVLASGILAAAQPAPTITALYPNAGPPSSAFSAVIHGTNLGISVSVSFGAGVSGAILPGGTATDLPITITVSSNAAAGLGTVTVTTSGGT